MKIKVKVENGCGDHVAAIIEADSVTEAVEKSYSLEEFEHTSLWRLVAEEYYARNRPLWLIDIEVYDHEMPNHDPKY